MRTYDVFENEISDEEEKKEEDLKLGLSHEGEHGSNTPSQCRLVPSLESPAHRCFQNQTIFFYLSLPLLFFLQEELFSPTS